MTLRIAIPDMVSPSYFPAIAAASLGFTAEEGLDMEVELIFPVTETFKALRDGTVDYVGGAAHAPLYAFDMWRGCKLVGALSQGMYWFLVLRADIEAQPGELEAVRGRRIAAAPGPVDGLRRMLQVAAINPDEDVDIVPVPASADASFGIAAAQALEEGLVDGFWANGMGAEVAQERGVGRVVVDARRGDGPPDAQSYTFPALVTTDQRIEERPDEVSAVVRAVVRAQRALASDPSRAQRAADPHFPAYESSLIERLIARDAPFYDPMIDEPAVAALCDFARDVGLLPPGDVAYEEVVAATFRSEWAR